MRIHDFDESRCGRGIRIILDSDSMLQEGSSPSRMVSRLRQAHEYVSPSLSVPTTLVVKRRVFLDGNEVAGFQRFELIRSYVEVSTDAAFHKASDPLSPGPADQLDGTVLHEGLHGARAAAGLADYSDFHYPWDQDGKTKFTSHFKYRSSQEERAIDEGVDAILQAEGLRYVNRRVVYPYQTIHLSFQKPEPTLGKFSIDQLTINLHHLK
jgi:hypothetical protein